ncbi:MAG: hypothetical protein ACRDYB_02500 [Acidimicrobiales bacterium]
MTAVTPATKEASEYEALDPYAQAVYDVLGQRAFDHEQCMAGVAEFRDATADLPLPQG